VGQAAQEHIRHKGSSGGVITALLCFLLEKKKIDGALVVGTDPLKPYRSKGILATSVEELLQASSSQYSVNASLAALRDLHKREGKFAVIALPCQVHALRKLPLVAPALAAKIELILGLSCACTMELQAVEDILEAKGLHTAEVDHLCFRGGDWPGALVAETRDGTKVSLYPSEAYSTVTNLLFRLYGAERCLVCVDGLAEYADLSFGDFWAADYADSFNSLTQCTLVSQRTAKGLEVLKEAEKAAALILHPLPADRFSKRSLDMVQEKRHRASVYAVEREKVRLGNPNYHISLPKPGFKEKKSTCSYLLLHFLRHKKEMRLALIKLLLNSRLGLLFHRLITRGQRLLGKYRNN
jgi:coenzyme F420 hydrogenase subunit beta